MKKKILFTFMFLLIILSILYFKPTHYYKSYTLCTIDGVTTEVIFDLKKYNHILKSPGLSGKIILDGIEFYSARDLYKSNYLVNDGTYYFVDSKKYALDSRINTILLDLSFDFNYINIFLTKSGKTYNYYGPASNSYEVQSIISMFN